MKYFVKYLLEGSYSLGDKFTARAGIKTECNKDIFEYLNSTFGDSGWFTFEKEGTETKAKTKVKPKSEPKVEPKSKSTKESK